MSDYEWFSGLEHPSGNQFPIPSRSVSPHYQKFSSSDCMCFQRWVACPFRPTEVQSVLVWPVCGRDTFLTVFENFHQNLKNLLTKIVLEHISTWRTEAQANQISLPRLVDLDWRVDIKTSSDSISRMAIPTCLLQMKIQEDPSLCGDKPCISAVTMELSKETLDTMLDGLGRIRDQLSAVASK
ncbi:COMM domain-containing protein 9 isoform X2 [Microtus ochrogaster]|uniref:COMM domain-containing protein 9 isoform X2 n=1 Tax=Microtus ochrogaster TaxID=79684 RepID=A0ABM1UNU6_MICOH|nr:COMM domain-containing protein 9 isoform X2 [Microtus ochrogaster]